MKTANSEGGPFIGLDLDLKPLWSGIAGKRFVGDGSPFATDYDAASVVVLSKPPRSIAKLSGPLGDALFLTMPLETAIIEADATLAYIAQVHYADEDWSFSRLSKVDFEKAEYDEHIPFSSESSTVVFFDAAYPAENVGEDSISFDLAKGEYILSAALYYPDLSTHCILYKIQPVE